jgi:hypothetical protein
LFGEVTATLSAVLYQISVPPVQPVAERVDEPAVVLVDGVAVGAVGAAVEFTVIVPVAVIVPQPPVNVTV